MTYWYNSVVFSTNLYFSPGIFPQILQTSFSETLNHSDGSGEPPLFRVPSLLASIILQQHPRLPAIQNRLSPASSISCIIPPHNSVQDASQPHQENGIHIFLHWDMSQLTLIIFLKPQLSLYPAQPWLNLHLILSGLYCHMSSSSFFYHIASAKHNFIKVVLISVLILFCLCLIATYSLNHVQLFATPPAVAHKAPLSTGLLRQEYWIGLPFPFPGKLLDFLHQQVDSFTTELLGKPV